MSSFSASDLPISFFLVLVSLLGLSIGSFLNVVIHRLPRAESIVLPRSHCPACQTPLPWYYNVPLLSWLWLRGRCHNCRARISWRYPLVELLTAVLFVAVLLKTGPTWIAAAQMFFVAVILALIFIDAEHHWLPDIITYPALLAALIFGALRSGWGKVIAPEIELSIAFAFPEQTFVPWRVALSGGLVLALAAPALWLLDVLDMVLFSKYFEWEEMNAAQEAADTEPTPEETEAEDQLSLAAERQRQRVVYATAALGLLLAAGWAALVYLKAPLNTFAYERAYNGLLRAATGALVASGIIWALRAAYFYLRGIEGMGLGDVKMMAMIGALLGWLAAFYVLALGSLLGTVFGLLVVWRSQGGWRTATPFGVSLGIAALLLLLTW